MFTLARTGPLCFIPGTLAKPSYTIGQLSPEQCCLPSCSSDECLSGPSSSGGDSTGHQGIGPFLSFLHSLWPAGLSSRGGPSSPCLASPAEVPRIELRREPQAPGVQVLPAWAVSARTGVSEFVCLPVLHLCLWAGKCLWVHVHSCLCWVASTVCVFAHFLLPDTLLWACVFEGAYLVVFIWSYFFAISKPYPPHWVGDQNWRVWG